MDREVTWKPNPGPQTWLLSCPVLDVFFGGARGGGKTDALLGDWAAHSARYGKDAHGIIFRRSMPELEDVIRRSREIYQPIGAEFREQSKTWVMPGGAELRMRYLEADADAARYQGHAYCVAVGTLILMVDQSWRPIESISIGDIVQTMEGPRRVTDTVAPYKAECVACSDGVLTQVHPIWHPIYGASGWQSYASLTGNDSKAFAGKAQAVGTLPSVSYQAKRLELAHDPLGQQESIQSDCRPGSLPESSETSLAHGTTLPSPLVDQPPAHEHGRLSQRCTSLPSVDGAAACAQNVMTPAQGSQADCLPSPRLGDGQQWSAGVSAQACVPSQDDVAGQTREHYSVDGLGNIPECSQSKSDGYPHPYTGEIRPLLFQTRDVALTMTPVGERMVCDLTVEGANHYITQLRIANKNTWMGFDEMGNWASPLPLDQLRACLRSNASVPCALRGTGNPGGPGHEWVKKRYIDPSPPLTPFTVGGITRVFIPSKLTDNPRLTNAEQYTANIRNSGPDWLVKAWLEGDWSGPPVGGIISPEWLRTYDALPKLGPISLAADLAYRVGQKNDESSIGAFGLTAESELVWQPDLVIGHLDTLQSVNAIMDLAQRYNVGEFYAARDMITGSIGPFLYKAMEERGCWFTLIEVANHQDQLLRSRSFIARTQQGKVLWPSGDLYRTKIQPQLVSYDGLGKQRDDIVAMATHACMGLDLHNDYRAPKEQKKDHPDHKRWKDVANRTRPVQDQEQFKLFGRARP